MHNDVTLDYNSYMEDTKKATARFGFLNYSALSLVRASHQTHAVEFMGAMVNDYGHNLAMVVSPSYSSQKGEGYRMEGEINKKLAEANLNIDRFWTLTFEKHEDPRDQRPLLHMGRIALPMNKQLKDSQWKHSGLFTHAACVGPCKASKTNDMEIIMDVTETALPKTTDQTTHMAPAEKVQQIGCDACVSILHACMDKMKKPDLCFSLVDLFLHTGDMIKAAILFQAELTTFMKIHSYASSDVEKEWLDQIINAWAREKFIDGTLKIRGAMPLPEEIPRDMLEADVPLPQLHVCTWNDIKVDGQPTLTLPDALYHKYSTHADQEICDRFNKLYEKAKGIINLKESPTASTPAKRTSSDILNPEPDEPLKKMKLEPGSPSAGLIGVADMPGTVCEAVLPASKEISMKVVIAVGNKLFLTPSNTDNDVALLPGVVVAGWWQGKWWHNSANKDLNEADVKFELKSTDDFIRIGSSMITLGTALAERRKSRPASTASVMYHDLVDAPTDDDPSRQTLSVKHDMVWRPDAGAPVKKEDNAHYTTMDHKHIAGAVPTNLWRNGVTDIVWTVRWSLKGLTPVRPAVALVVATNVTASKALPLST